MKKNFTIALLVGISASAIGQKISTQQELPAVKAQLSAVGASVQAHSQPTNQLVNRGGGDAFYEDFANGITGNNDFGSWTIEDNGDDEIWMEAVATSPGGEWNDGAGQLESSSADNGWMIFDADSFNVQFSPNYVSVFGYLTSPVVDLSDLSSVIIEYQHYWRYCCYGYSPMFIEVTHDGGATWDQYDALNGGYSAVNEGSANPVTSGLDISCSAAGYSAVQFRFSWLMLNEEQGNSHYFWGVDDVRLYGNTVTHEIAVSLITNGDIFTDFEYRATPLEQIPAAADGGLLIGTVYRNNGTSDEDATVNMQLLDADDNVVQSWSTDITIPSNANLALCGDQTDTLYYATNWEPTGIGEFTITTEVVITGDEDPSNNSLERKIWYTTDEYGHDDIGDLAYEVRALAGETTGTFDPTGYGSYLSMLNDGSTAYGLIVKFGSHSDNDATCTALLLLAAEDYNLTDAETVAAEEYEVQAEWSPQGNSQVVETYLPFAQEETIDAGRYFAGILNEEENSELEITVKATEEIDEDFSSGMYARTNTDEFIWFFGISQSQWSPGIRLIFSDRTGIDELQLAYLGSYQLSPNPATTQSTINLNLKETVSVSYEVRDITGKLVKFDNLGRLPVGDNNIQLDTQSWSAGSYTVSLVLDAKDFVSRTLEVIK